MGCSQLKCCHLPSTLLSTHSHFVVFPFLTPPPPWACQSNRKAHTEFASRSVHAQDAVSLGKTKDPVSTFESSLIRIAGGLLQCPTTQRKGWWRWWRRGRRDLELACLLVLGQVAVRLEQGVGGQPDVLVVLGADGVLPVGQPRHRVVVPDLHTDDLALGL